MEYHPNPHPSFTISTSTSAAPNPYYDHQQALLPYYPPNPNPSAPSAAADPYAAHHLLPYAQAPPPEDASAHSAKEAVRHFGFDPIAYAAAIASSYQTTFQTLSQANSVQTVPRSGFPGLGYRKPKKPAKIPQPATCPVCKIECNSQDVLSKHVLGRKHKRNVEKLRENLSQTQQPSQPTMVSTPAIKSVAASETNPIKTKPVPGTPKDLETKKRKVLEGGAAQAAMRVCTLCNVVCNSEVVFSLHIAGQKHASMVKNKGAVGS